MSNPTYSDFTDAFIQHPVRRELSIVTEEAAVKQSIKNLVLTDFYERPFAPGKGCGVRGLLFEPIDPHTQQAIERAITSTIENWERRCNLISVSAIASSDENYWTITITFTLLNSEVPVQIPVLLFRVR